MANETKIFDEQYVDCNSCSNYWNDSCDGLPLDRVKHCNSYKAMRMVDIPNEIIKIKRSIKLIRISLLCITLAVALMGGVVYFV